jgi:hypothetical protein
VVPRAGLDDLEDRKIAYPCRDSNHISRLSSHCLVTIPTELSRFSSTLYCYLILLKILNVKVDLNVLQLK